MRKNAVSTEGVEGEARSSVISSEPGSEMMAMFRVLMEEQRKAELAREEARREDEERKEEARRLAEERRETIRVEREIEATRKQLEQQTALEARQYEQQVALMKIHAEIGEKASRLHREEQSLDRKRDRALASISNLRDGEDLEEFLLTAERRLRAAGIKTEDWIAIIDSKLNGKMASAWQDICVTIVEYQEAKDRLLKMCGYTPRLAADVFLKFKSEHSNGMTADQLYHRGLQLLRRMVAPSRASEEVEFAILRGWVGTVVSKRARAALDARVVENAADLINALQDHLVLEGDRTEGQAAIFKKVGGEGSKDRVSSLTCFKCGKTGHKAFECWAGKGGPSSSLAETAPTSSGTGSSKIVCYTCVEEGHKSPQCPKNIKGEKTGPKDLKPKPVKRIWRSQPSSVQLSGEVNGQEVMILLDSGAAISVVPESLVTLALMTGCNVAVKPFGSRKPKLLPTAELSFKIGSLEWVETVAVAPRQEGVETEVLYSLDLQSQRGLELVLVANKVDQKEVLSVTTRSQAKQEVKEQEEEAVTIAEEVLSVKSLPREVKPGQEVINEPETAIALEELSIRAGCLGRKEEESEEDILGRKEEEFEEEFLGDEKEPSEESEEEKYDLRSDSREEAELVVPPIRAGG